MPILSYGKHAPEIAPSAFVAPSADVIGQVFWETWYRCGLGVCYGEIRT